MARLPRSFGSMLLLFLLALGCRPAEVPTAPEASDDFASQLLAAKQREATDPLDASGYLALIDGALASPDDPQALAAALAATEALVWRDVPGLAGNLALVHRSAPLLSATAAHLRRAWARDEGHPLVRGMIASAIHDLALHVGAIEDARRWRQRAGCPAAATLVGPVGFPPLLALEEAPQVPVRGALPATFPGQPPFATDVEPETIYGDACSFDVEETSPLRGERALLVDVERKAEGETFFAVSSASAAKLLAGGKLVVERPFAAGGASVTVLGRAQLPEGRTRLLLRVADNQDGDRVALQIWDEHGAPLRTYAPRPGMVADGVPRDAGPVALPAATRETMVLAVAARLALGEARDALQLLEGDLAPSGADTPAVLDLLRLEAIGRSMALPPNQAMERRLTAAQRAAQDCPSCWEARIARAGLEGERKGYGTGTYAALADLELDAADPESLRAMGIMELVYVAQQAAQQGLGDLARQAYDELATRLPGSILVAELDQRLFNRVGAEGVAAACSSGLDRSRSFCLDALLREPDLEAALRELARLRRLRGNPSTMLELELSRLLAHGRREEAMEIYDALPPARRDLAVLGIDLGTDREAQAKARFQRDMLRAGDAPWSYEPLVRWLEIEGDPAPGFDREGAALVAQDRREAFLPGAGTAVLRRVERYDLRPGGLLHYLIYDLRRVGGTTDVAGGTWMGLPGVDGRGATRFMRRRIYKPDGRILDPDPNAGGQQGDTDLAQLESGDYVEALVSGWALPAEHGQLTLDSPDLMPERTSLREATVRLRHPENLELREWHHPLLGEGKVTVENGRREVVWELRDRAPRTLEAGVPALESRVGLSFGTDSYARIARALADRFASLDEEDPYVARWLADQGVKREMPVEERIGMVVAAVGKALRQADPSALGDFVATMGGGSQNETARWILERGTGSRTWVVHRALRAAGIESEIVVAETRPFSAAPGFPPHVGRFTHPLVRVEQAGKVTWIDADVAGPPLPPGRVSPELRGRMGLRASGEMIEVNAEVGADLDEARLDLVVDGSGAAKGRLRLELHGAAAQALTDALEIVRASAREEMLRRVVLAWIPGADIASVTLTSEASAFVLALEAQVILPAFAIPSDRDGHLQIAGSPPLHGRGGRSTLSARYAAEGERSGALALDDPQFYQLKRSITFPAGTVVTRPPPAFDVDLGTVDLLHGAASRRVTIDGVRVEDVMRLELPVGTVEADAFPRFAEQIRVIDDAFLHGIEVQLPR